MRTADQLYDLFLSYEESLFTARPFCLIFYFSFLCMFGIE